MRITFVGIIAVLATAIVPPSKILVGIQYIKEENIEFNTLAANAQTYQVSFGNKFDVIPNFGLAYTGLDHPAVFTTVSFGWKFAVSSKTQSGATLTVTVLNSFNSIKLKSIATQGDRLQVFYLEVVVSISGNTLASLPFDYSNLVTFDLTNPPDQVFVGTFLAGCQGMNNGGIFRAFVNPTVYLANLGDWVEAMAAQNYADLYGPQKTFTDTGNLMLRVGMTGSTPVTIQFTLFLHRVSLSSENPKTNGYYYYFTGQSLVSGSRTVNTSDPDDNPLPGSAQNIIGIVGFQDYYVKQATPIGTVSSTKAINFTDIEHVTLTASGFAQHYPDSDALFYLCDTSCATCYGILPNECLTCPNGSPPYNGICCPNGCATCSSTIVCLTCDLHSFRVASIDANNRCPCLPHFYENASGKCVQCPPTCETCQLAGGSPTCLTCFCAQHREFNSGACDCKTGFHNDTAPRPYCLKDTAT